MASVALEDADPEGALLSVAGRLARDGETQLKQSPENPGRFRELALAFSVVPAIGIVYALALLRTAR